MRSNCRSRLRPTLGKLAASFILVFLALHSVPAQSDPSFTRTEDVIYGRKFGTALTLDVLQPGATNGLGIVWIVSGGWYSSHDAINPGMVAALLNRGYTVFAVVHGSQPKFIVTEIIPDIHRAVRFIRKHAAKYGIDPNRLGVTGGSAGGHLSLIIATQGGPGDPKAKDPVDRESSAVQCVACFFPPTDFLNYNAEGDDAVGVGTLKDFQSGFGDQSRTAEGRHKLGLEISPIYFVHSNMPPVLIIQGDADKLVPIFQAQRFLRRCDELHVPTKLIVREGKQHGWPGMEQDVGLCADWFDKYLKPTR